MLSQHRLEALVRKKESEAKALEKQLREIDARHREVKAYLQALQDMQRLLPRAAVPSQSQPALREGSDMAKVRDALRAANRPLHIGALLEKIGKENSPKNRLSLVGSLSSYARKGLIFTKPAPNTFYLLEMSAHAQLDDEPPEDFGFIEN